MLFGLYLTHWSYEHKLYLTEKFLNRLKSRNHEASRICGYKFISKANSKFFQQRFTFIYSFVHCMPLFLISSKRLLGPTTYLMIYKCQLTIWLCSLAVKISDVPCTGEVVSLFTKKTGNCLTFFGLHHCKKLWQCKPFWTKFKFTLLMKFLPINP